jgi:serine/threonine protein kinase
MIDLFCPHCHKSLKVKGDLAGKQIHCPHCRHALEVPREAAGEATAAPPGTPPGQAQASLADAATVPPSSCSAPGADDVTCPPASPPGRSAPACPEVVTAGSAYQMGGEIARGGMGAVLRAVDQGIGREVAVKFLLEQTDEAQRARFVEEARITGRLEHPNVVPIHQLGVHADGRCFFSMKMVKGRSLADILKAQGKEKGAGAYTLVRLLGVFTGICNALGYAHSRNVIHRDLKPANVMVGDFGEVYVMDWGLAKVLGGSAADIEREPAPNGGVIVSEPSQATAVRNAEGGLTQAGAVMGTPAYMPPEQATGQAVDRRSDVYSLGAILYEILTLTPPVVGSDPLAILMRVAERDIESPAQRAPQRARQGWVPPELSAIALKALARAPADRYQSVEVLRHDVELYLEGRSVSAKRDTAWELFKKLVRRNKGVSVATAAAVLVLAVVVGVAFYLNNRERLQAQEARKQAEENHAAYLKAQDEKREGLKKSAPAFLRAAQYTADQKQFGDALAQVSIALDSDPSLTEGHRLKGQLLLTLGRYAEAAEPLRDYLALRPDDAAAGKLLRLAEQPRNEPAYLWAIARVLEEQKFFGGMWQVDRKFAESLGPLKDRLPGYQKMIDAAWPGLKLGNGLTRTREGKLQLGIDGKFDEVRDLGGLAGIPINLLSLRDLKQLNDLEGLRGMPLTWLDLFDCSARIKTLDPLAGMKLTHLRLRGAGPYPDVKALKNMPLQELFLEFSEVQDLDPLRGAPLKSLTLYDCRKIQDLSPLRGAPLTFLSARDCTEIRDIAPLKGMQLTSLDLLGAHRVPDLSPLENMPLERLLLPGLVNVRDFRPLQGLVRLKVLHLQTTAIDDLRVLKDLPLTELSLAGCMKFSSLKPLRDLKHLEVLYLTGCTQIRDFTALTGLPLKRLYLKNCSGLTDLGFIRGMKLDYLGIEGCRALRDLGPLADTEVKELAFTPGGIKKGMDVLRRMKALKIAAPPHPWMVPADFWKKYDTGEIK